MSEANRDEKPKMAPWYAPLQLINTGVKTAISTIVGEYADPRLGTADPTLGKYFDYSKQIRAQVKENDFEPIQSEAREDIWIDYVADVGDGWNPTYAVAYMLAKPELKAAFKKHEWQTERGEILILGGDSVYPTASETEYEQRLVTPYRMAWRANLNGGRHFVEEEEEINLRKNPHIFALPGNHDWYDSLNAFRKLFCSHLFNDRSFAAGWRTRQKRSYFAVKLPQKWWLLGVDLQLSHDIDTSQLNYFESIVSQMEEGDRVILCVPEPYWVKTIKYEGISDLFIKKEISVEKLERFFEKREIEIKVYIAGDLHHYRRFRDNRNIQRITAGGGGAFLHPTHDFDFDKYKKIEIMRRCFGKSKTLGVKVFLRNLWQTPTVEFLLALAHGARKKDEPKPARKEEPISEVEIQKIPSAQERTEKKSQKYSLQTTYPPFAESRTHDWKNFLFLWNNKTFGFFTAIVYTILAWFIYSGIERADTQAWIQDAQSAFDNLFNSASLSVPSIWNLLKVLFGGNAAITVSRLIREPVAAIIVILMMFGLIFFTDSNSRPYKWFAGFLHGAAHLSAAFLLSWASYLCGVLIIQKYHAGKNVWWVWVLSFTIFFLLGYIVGAVIMGVYLFVSLHIFGRHDNEAFSALKIEDFKNFLRLRIDKDGKLTIFPFKIEKVPRRWKDEKAGKEILYRLPQGESSLAGDENKLDLIEKPVEII